MSPLRRALARIGLIVAVAIGAVAAGASDAEPEAMPPLDTVPHVDLERYAGLWFEIARIPNRFQKQCARGTTAEYTLREDGRLTVVNRCVKADGEVQEARGVAKVADETSRAKLKVSFVSFLGWRPFWGDYWVIGLAEDYGWAVVGSPDRNYGWILARTPTLEPATLVEIFAVLEEREYRREAFVPSFP